MSDSIIILYDVEDPEFYPDNIFVQFVTSNSKCVLQFSLCPLFQMNWFNAEICTTAICKGNVFKWNTIVESRFHNNIAYKK